jgi:hypothetical protein
VAGLPKPEMEKGRPCGRPFHCRAVVRLNYRKDVVFQTSWTPTEARIQLTDAGDRGDRQ